MQESTFESWRSSLLTEEERSHLESRASIVTYTPGAVILRKGEPSTFVLYLLEGYVKVVSADTKVMADIRWPGEIVGELGPLNEAPRSADLIAMTAVKGLLVHSAVWLRFIGSHPRAACAHYVALARRFGEGEAIRGESGAGSQHRVASYLLRLLDTDIGEKRDGTVLFRGISQKDLGKLVKLSRESVSAVLGELRKEGAVTTGRGSFTVLDRAPLERMASRRAS